MKKVLNNIKFYILNLSLRTKLILSFVILILLPVGIIVMQNFRLSSNLLEKKTQEYSHDISAQILVNIEYNLKTIEDITFNIIGNTELQQLLYDSVTKQLDPDAQVEMKSSLETMMSSYALFHDEIIAMYIVAEDGSIYEHNKTHQNFDIKTDDKAMIYGLEGDIYWYNTNAQNQSIVLTRSINNLRTQKPIGYIVIHLREQFIYDIIQDLQYVESGEVFLINDQNRIVSHQNKALLGSSVKNQILPYSLDSNEYSFYTDIIEDERMYISASAPTGYGWRLISIIPSNYYQAEIISLRFTTVSAAVIVAMAAILLAILLTKNISAPLRLLSDAMYQFGKGDFSVNCSIDSQDEVGKLSQSFNRMVSDMNELIGTVYEEQLLKQEAELKSLQMQINPHFLYNSLETINWTARAKGVKEVGEMAKSLGDLMRSTISGGDFVTLEEEVRTLGHYLNMQKYRYGDKLNAVVDIPESLYGYVIPKLIIQPILENAIVHGIEPKIEEGRVEITVRKKAGDLVITVNDDGIGMDMEAIDKIFSDITDIKKEGHTLIGIHNVNRRIKMYYGSNYGLQIQNDVGEGTNITMTVKAITEFEYNLKSNGTSPSG